MNAVDPLGENEYYEEYETDAAADEVAGNLSPSIKITIKGAHGFRHFVTTGLNATELENEIMWAASELVTTGGAEGNFWSFVQLSGYDVWFRAWFVTATWLEIATYTIGH